MQPVLLYGLGAVGVTQEVLLDLGRLVAKHVRIIGRCHSYSCDGLCYSSST